MRWTDIQIKTLIDLFNMGLSASKIGKQLGMDKNCVIGKLYRLRRNAYWAQFITRPANMLYAQNKKRQNIAEKVIDINVDNY